MKSEENDETLNGEDKQDCFKLLLSYVNNSHGEASCRVARLIDGRFLLSQEEELLLSVALIAGTSEPTPTENARARELWEHATRALRAKGRYQLVAVRGIGLAEIMLAAKKPERAWNALYSIYKDVDDLRVPPETQLRYMSAVQRYEELAGKNANASMLHLD